MFLFYQMSIYKNPFKKLKYFDQGKKLLESAIKEDQNQ